MALIDRWFRKDIKIMKKKAIICGLVIALMLSITVTAYAASVYQMTYLPGTTDTVTNLPDADDGTGGEAYTVSSTIPQRAGYEFIDWTLDYGVGYKVTYVVNPDKTYGTPEGSTVPTDPTRYKPGGYVDVKPQLTTTVDYAYNGKDEKVTGTWKFEVWDKDDFAIYADTTITGGWVFAPTPATKFHYTVEYWLWDGVKRIKKVHADKEVWIDSLDIWRREDALPLDELKKPFSVKKNGAYLYRIVTPYQEKVISKDGEKIYILYEEIPKGR